MNPPYIPSVPPTIRKRNWNPDFRWRKAGLSLLSACIEDIADINNDSADIFYMDGVPAYSNSDDSAIIQGGSCGY